MRKSAVRTLCLVFVLLVAMSSVFSGCKNEKDDKNKSTKTTALADKSADTATDTDNNADDPEEKTSSYDTDHNPFHSNPFDAGDGTEQTGPVSADYFDDAVFIGDSVTVKLQYYNNTTAALGKATFLCIGSYSVTHAIHGTLDLTFRGKVMPPEDAVAACKAKKVFIMLGMNDIGYVPMDECMANWATLIKNIRAKNPKIQIFIQSGTPIYIGGQTGSLTNAKMDEYNINLKKFAKANDCRYIDVATPMKDVNNGLKLEYCSDNYVHMSDAGCELWAVTLKNSINKK